MQTSKTIAKNKAFFNRYAELFASLSSVATIAQIITGVCEVGILYSLFYSSFAEIVPLSYLNGVSILCAIVCATMLQLGLKKVYPYFIRAVLHRHFKGLDLAISIGIGILNLSLLAASVTLSWQGSKEIAEVTVSKPIEKNTISSDSLKQNEVNAALRLYTSDSATIETKYGGKIEAINSTYTSQINAIERTGHKKATSLRAELKTKLGQLQTDKASELEAKAAIRDANINHARDRNDKEITVISTDNGTAKNEANFKKEKYKNYIGFFNLFCYIFFLLIYALREIYHKGAIITEKPIPSQRHFNASLLAELLETIKEKLDVFFRTKLYAWHDSTNAQPLPNALRTLYEFESDVLEETLKIQSEAQNAKVIIKIPMKSPKVHKLAASSDKSSDDTKDDTTQKRAQIGFVKRDDTNDDTKENRTPTKIVGGGIVENKTIVTSGTDIIGQCPICLNSFIKNHRKQVYCGTKCRQENHVKRGGKLHESIKVK